MAHTVSAQLGKWCLTNNSGMRPSNASLGIILLLFSRHSLGQNLGLFLTEHREQIQTYIMAGYGDGWSHCDVLSADALHTETLFHGLSPQFVIDFAMLNKLDMNSMLPFSHCLLVAYLIKSRKDLSDILQFGQTVLRHKRIALILSLENEVTLNMATDIAEIPFLVAAELEGGGEHFLCPIVGSPKPILQDSMCNIMYTSYRYKKLRMGIFGGVPHIFHIKGKGIDGTDYRMIKLLAEKLKFVPDVKIVQNKEQGNNMVVRNSNN